MPSIREQIIKNHFSTTTLRNLKKKGIVVMSTTSLPDANGSFLNSQTGYNVDDNGTGRVWTLLEVLEKAKYGN